MNRPRARNRRTDICGRLTLESRSYVNRMQPLTEDFRICPYYIRQFADLLTTYNVRVAGSITGVPVTPTSG